MPRLPSQIPNLFPFFVFHPTFLIIPRLFLIRCHINICKLIYKTSQISSISWPRFCPVLRRMRGSRRPELRLRSGLWLRLRAASAMRSDSSSPWLALSGQEQKLVTSYYKSKEWCCDNDNWSCNINIQTIYRMSRLDSSFICAAPHRLGSAGHFRELFTLLSSEPDRDLEQKR